MVPPPIAMLELITELWAAQAITAAADLGIADALANGPLSADELAGAVNADADALREMHLTRSLLGHGPMWLSGLAPAPGQGTFSL